MELRKIKKVTFKDYTGYDAEKCHDGGAYGFWTNYIRLDGEKWEVSHGTTADFCYCPVCGSFADHYEGDDCYYQSGYSCGEFETVTEKELLDRVNSFQETESEYIEFDGHREPDPAARQRVLEAQKAWEERFEAERREHFQRRHKYLG